MAAASHTPSASAPALLPRIAAGDQAAVREFMDRYSGLVWSLARRLSANDPDAEDAVHEIFIDLWKSAARFDSNVASEVTFVAMIARRRLIDRRRRSGRQPRMELIREDQPIAASNGGGVGGSAGADGAGTPDASVQLGEEAKVAVEALSRLNPEQQRVLRLSIFHGLSHEKIAAATGLPLGTVKTHARRGLIRIRESLEAAVSNRVRGVATS